MFDDKNRWGAISPVYFMSPGKLGAEIPPSATNVELARTGALLRQNVLTRT